MPQKQLLCVYFGFDSPIATRYDYALMLPELPAHIELSRCVRLGTRLHVCTELRNMHRLGKYLHAQTGQATVELQFGTDGEGVAFVRGRGAAQVEMLCQRCLEPMICQLVLDFRLGILRSETQAGQLPKAYDPWVVEEDPVSLRDMLEDELILALPLTALHPPRDCSVQTATAGQDGDVDAGASRADHPFAVLAKLKTPRDS